MTKKRGKKSKKKSSKAKGLTHIEIVALGDDGFHLFCKAKMNGKKIRALIDTGASKTVLSSSYAKKLGKKKYVEVLENETSGIGPEQLQPEFIEVKSIELGKIKVKKHVIGILDMSHVVDLYKKLGIKPFDLLIGSDILLELNALIDFGRAQLYTCK